MNGTAGIAAAAGTFPAANTSAANPSLTMNMSAVGPQTAVSLFAEVLSEAPSEGRTGLLGVLARVLRIGGTKTPEAEETGIRKRIERLLVQAQELHTKAGREGFSCNEKNKHMSKAFERCRDAAGLMVEHGISEVTVGGRMQTIADVQDSLAFFRDYYYFPHDHEGTAEEYLKAASLYAKENRMAESARALRSRAIEFGMLAEDAESRIKQNSEGEPSDPDKQRIRVAYGRELDAYLEFLTCYLKLTDEEKNNMHRISYETTPAGYIKEYARILEKAGRVDEAINVYAALAGMLAKRARGAQRSLDAVPAREKERDAESFLALVSDIHVDFKSAYKHITKRLELLGAMGRFGQIAEEMEPVVEIIISAKEDYTGFIDGFVKAHPGLNEKALAGATAALRIKERYIDAARYEEQLAIILAAKGDHAGAAEAFKRVAYDHYRLTFPPRSPGYVIAYPIFTEEELEEVKKNPDKVRPRVRISRNRGINIDMQILARIIEALEKYSAELAASGRDENGEKQQAVLGKIRELRDFCEGKAGVRLEWLGKGQATLAPLLGLKEFLGIADTDRTAADHFFEEQTVARLLPHGKEQQDQNGPRGILKVSSLRAPSI